MLTLRIRWRILLVPWCLWVRRVHRLQWQEEEGAWRCGTCAKRLLDVRPTDDDDGRIETRGLYG